MNELQHYGIPGMKWGIRRYQNKNGNYTPLGRKRYLDDKTAGLRKKIDRLKESGNDRKLSRLENKLLKKEQKLGRKYDLADAYNKIDKETGLAEKMFFSNGVRKKAAKFVVDNNMSILEARRKSRGWAVKQVAKGIAVYGALTLVAAGLSNNDR